MKLGLFASKVSKNTKSLSNTNWTSALVRHSPRRKPSKLVPVLLAFFILNFSFGIVRADMLWSTGVSDDRSKSLETQVNGLTMDFASDDETHPVRGQVVASLITTSSRLVRAYPADAINYFHLGKHKVVHFYAYLLFTPPAPISHKIVNEWLDTNGEIFCRKEITIQPSYPDDVVRVGDESYLYYLFLNHVGLEANVEAAGQTRVPKEVGRYTIRLLVDGQQKAVTFFRLMKGSGSTRSLPSGDDLKNSILPEPFRKYSR